jgi:hypothetical protein|tara:strand:+ start:384 stop:650 length:267 start_codon:yes stop_codon:yes gene_type:complete
MTDKYKFRKENIDGFSKNSIVRDNAKIVVLRQSIEEAGIFADPNLMSSVAIQISFLEGKIQAHEQMMMICQIQIEEIDRLNKLAEVEA